MIVSVNGNAVSTVEQFEAQVEAAKKDGACRLRVLNGSLFRFVAPGATGRRLVPLHTTVALGRDGTATAGA